MADTTYRREDVRSDLVAAWKEPHRLSLAGIFVGAFTALALGLLFISLGVAAGIVNISAAGPAAAAHGWVGGGVWVLVSIFVASYIGAAVGVKGSALTYRRDGGLQGMVTWALSFLFTMVLLGSIVAAVMGNMAAAGGGGGSLNGGPGWWFFISACAGLVGGIFGGLSGVPVHGEHGKEVGARRSHVLREREV